VYISYPAMGYRATFGSSKSTDGVEAYRGRRTNTFNFKDANERTDFPCN